MTDRGPTASQELHQIKQLVRVAADALTLAQTLLADRIEQEKTAARQRRKRPLEVQASEDVLANIRNIATAFEEQLTHPDRKFSECWRDLVKTRIHHRIHRAGRPGAAILLRMIEKPDVFVDQKVLASSAGVASKSPNVIKVYVCHLRNGLEDHGLPADLIETGTRSYRLRAHAIPKIMELVTRP